MLLLIDCVCQTICDISKNTVCYPVIFPAQKVMHDGGGQTHRFRQYLKYFRTFQVFVEILNGNNVRKCEKKSASFTVYVDLCETNCTNEESALSVSPSSKTFMPLHFVAFEKSNREKFVLRSCVLKGTLSADRKELRRRQKKGSN